MQPVAPVRHLFAEPRSELSSVGLSANLCREYEPPKKPRPDHSQYRARDQHVAQRPAPGGLGLFDLVECPAHLAQRRLLDRALCVLLDRSAIDVVRCLDAHVGVPSSEMSCPKTDRSRDRKSTRLNSSHANIS